MPDDLDFGRIGRIGHDIQHAGRGIAAEQRALRPGQDFDPRHVEQLRRIVRRIGQRDAIDHDADAAFRRARERHASDPANAERAIRPCNIERRHRTRQIADLVDVLPDQLCALHQRNRDRYLLQPLLAPVRGDDDLGNVIVRVRVRGGDSLRGNSLRSGQAGQHDAERCGGKKHGVTGFHRYPPCCGSIGRTTSIPRNKIHDSRFVYGRGNICW